MTSKHIKRIKKTKKKPVVEVIASPDTTIDPLDPDDKLGKDLAGKMRFEHTVEMLVIEWAFFYANHTPTAYLEFKGYTSGQIANVFRVVPGPDWYHKRETAQNRVTETLVKRHVDLIAKQSEAQAKSGELVQAKALEMLSKGVLDADGKTRKPIGPTGLQACARALESAQKMYRIAMGLPNTNDLGMQQVLKSLEGIRTAAEIAAQTPKTGDINIQVQNNVQNVNVDPTTKTPHELTYEDIMAMIEIKREQKAKLVAAQEKEKPKQIVSRGEADFTALKR